MGVQTVLQDIQSGYLSATTFTANNNIITTALDSALDRTGSVNNAMLVNLDMGLKNQINLKDGVNPKDGVNLSQVQGLIFSNSTGLISRLYEQNTVSTGNLKLITLSSISYVQNTNNIMVFVNGIAKESGIDYIETSSTSIDFVNSLVVGDTVVTYVNESTTSSVTNAQNVAYTEENTNVAIALAKRNKVYPTLSVLLSSLDFSVGDYVETMGYTSINDFGGNTYLVTDGINSRPVEDKGHIIYLTGGSGFLYLEGMFLSSCRVEQFGIIGDLDISLGTGTDNSAAFQAAINYVLGILKRKLTFGKGAFGAHSLTFPNTSFIFQGENPTDSILAPLGIYPNVNVIDLTNANGPGKILRNFKVQSSLLGNPNGVVGIYTSATNGLLLDRIWASGCSIGFRMHGSFIDSQNIVAEFCTIGWKADSILSETNISGYTGFSNTTDMQTFAGDNSTLNISNVNMIDTRSNGIIVFGDNTNFSNISSTKSTSTQTPNIINILGNNNNFNNIIIKDHGLIGIFNQASSYNKFSNIDISGVNTGIKESASLYNKYSNVDIKNSTTAGIRILSSVGTSVTSATISYCTIGLSITALTKTNLSKIDFISNTTDMQEDAINSTNIRINSINGDISGISHYTPSDAISSATDAEFNSSLSIINTSPKKVEGYRSYNTDKNLYVISSGSLTTSLWVFEGTGNTANTPV